MDTRNPKTPRRKHRQYTADIGLSNMFLDKSLQARERKAKINILSHKLSTIEEAITKMKRIHTAKYKKQLD